MNTACDSTYYYKADLYKLNITEKIDLVFGITLNEDKMKMCNFNVILKKKQVYVKIRALQLAQLLEFVRSNSISQISVIVSNARCRKKMFEHNDLRGLKFFEECKMSDPKFGYYCCPKPNQTVPVFYFGLSNDE